MITLQSKGSFNNTYRFLEFLNRKEYFKRLNEYGQKGVDALSAATPKKTGLTAASWSYEIKEKLNGLEIIWTNSNKTENGIPIVILLQYGHGTSGGAYVQGRDFINPALKPIFDQIADDVWKEVTDA